MIGSTPYEEVSTTDHVRNSWETIPWIFRLGSNREANRLQEVIHADEQIRGMVTGRYEKGRGIVTLTDQRILFIYEGYTRSSSEDLVLEHVSSVQWRSTLFKGAITVSSTGGDVVISNVYYNGRKWVNLARAEVQRVKKAQERRREAERQRGRQGTPPRRALGVSAADLMSRLERLDDLRNHGILSEEEYQEARLSLGA